MKTGEMAYCVNGKVIYPYPGDTIFVNASQILYSLSVGSETAAGIGAIRIGRAAAQERPDVGIKY